MSALPQNPPSVPSTPDPVASTSEQSLAPVASAGAAMSMLRDVEVEITLEIGRRRMKIADVLKLASGQTLELGKAAGEPLDIFVNGRLLGRGEAIVLGDRYGVRITEIVASTDEGAS
jgi:flagellar motor switch protein FliN/FliY